MNRKITKECESSCEYVLPDYMVDIRKVLTCRARIVPGGSFVSDGAFEVSGVVEYEITYADSENRLTVISCSSDYSVTAAVDTEACDGAFAESVIYLFSAPRNLSKAFATATDNYLDVLVFLRKPQCNREKKLGRKRAIAVEAT